MGSLPILFLGIAQAGILEAHGRLLQLVEVEVVIGLQARLVRALIRPADRWS
jgi:hypothetical protein